MRPAGDISKALLEAVDKLATPERAPTLQELVANAGVPLELARQTLKDMKRYGRVCSPRTRRVDYRNRPVAEYARSTPGVVAMVNESLSGLSAVIAAWG